MFLILDCKNGSTERKNMKRYNSNTLLETHKEEILKKFEADTFGRHAILADSIVLGAFAETTMKLLSSRTSLPCLNKSID